MSLRRAALVCACAVLASAGAAPAAPPTVRWCGTVAAAARDRPDALAGAQVHVIYAIPSDGPNRLEARAAAIVSDLARIAAWWRGEDPGRGLRFDLFAGTCDTAFGRVDVSLARLPIASSALTRVQGRQAPQVIGALRSAGFSATAKKYLVFYDGSIDPGSHSCGTSQGGSPLQGATFSIVPLRDGSKACGTIGTGGLAAVVAVHELLHNLGAVPKGAPHRCADSGHVCAASTGDVMLPGGKGHFRVLADAHLDPGHDDYYGHGGPWWDLQDSPWLAAGV